MDDHDKRPDERIKANEPQPVADADRSVEKTPPSDPAEAAARESAIDDDTAGDGVAFFEGGDGREAAREDIERSG